MSRHLLGLILVALAFGCVPTVVEGSGPRLHRMVDPYSEERFSCAGRPDGRLHNNPNESRGYNGFRIVTDLNFDGREDLILSTHGDSDGGCGNAGCAVTVYLMQADKSYATAVLLLHPLAAALEKVAPGRGTLATYQHLSADEGTLDLREVTARSMTKPKSAVLRIKDSTQDEQLYARWFNGALALHAEYSRCVGGELRWSDSYE